ncbi:hypothetical protein NDU88_004360 [Pleurodeles waltl]|uniref:Uncharacterized protein n=1 Tax=Pleurodeles waltl TaxID=8319 RepID=A0AAV7RLC0_PLEWA|nr:hypothetical protein NDU88_004360 [Pleurodeles waltl]
MQISAAERSEVERHFGHVGASHLTHAVFAPRQPAEGRLLSQAHGLLLPPADVGAGSQRCCVDTAVCLTSAALQNGWGPHRMWAHPNEKPERSQEEAERTRRRTRESQQEEGTQSMVTGEETQDGEPKEERIEDERHRAPRRKPPREDREGERYIQKPATFQEERG